MIRSRFLYGILVLVLAIHSLNCSGDELSVAGERDLIFGLLAYGVVYKDWQTVTEPQPRGYNIGAVLVDPAGRPVFWARNASVRTGNATQHGEVRAIENFLNCPNHKMFLDGYTIYTTLEPCAMCTGMMLLTSIDRVVYGQDDPEFGRVMPRLDETPGLPPYPRGLESVPLQGSAVKQALDEGFARSGGSVVRFLISDEARSIFRDASEQFATYQVIHEVNRPVLESARAFLESVPVDYVANPTDYCPRK